MGPYRIIEVSSKTNTVDKDRIRNAVSINRAAHKLGKITETEQDSKESIRKHFEGEKIETGSEDKTII